MITDHVPAVRLPPDHAGGLMAAAVAAWGAAVPVASSALVSCRFMLPPARLAACRDARTGAGLRATSVAVSGLRW